MVFLFPSCVILLVQHKGFLAKRGGGGGERERDEDGPLIILFGT
jgi:hypothetical protein